MEEKFYLKAKAKPYEFDLTEISEEKKGKKKYVDEPYLYHANLLKVLKIALIGNGAISNIESMFSWGYFTEILIRPDCFLEKDVSSKMGNEEKNLGLLVKEKVS